MPHNTTTLKAAVAGGLTGIVNGIFGAGGGMLLVPLLLRWLKIDDKKALATSVAIILPLCALSAAVYLANNSLSNVNPWPFLLGGLAGGILAGLTFGKLNADWLRRAFALLVLYGGVRALLT